MVIEFEAAHVKYLPRMLATARLVFGPGPLEGLMLTGFAIWADRDDENGVSVTFPAKPDPKTHKYYWFLRSVDPADQDATFRFRQRIITAYHKWVSEQGV